MVGRRDMEGKKLVTKRFKVGNIQDQIKSITIQPQEAL